jgi:hypothetical protein
LPQSELSSRKAEDAACLPGNILNPVARTCQLVPRFIIGNPVEKNMVQGMPAQFKS